MLCIGKNLACSLTEIYSTLENSCRINTIGHSSWSDGATSKVFPNYCAFFGIAFSPSEVHSPPYSDHILSIPTASIHILDFFPWYISVHQRAHLIIKTWACPARVWDTLAHLNLEDSYAPLMFSYTVDVSILYRSDGNYPTSARPWYTTQKYLIRRNEVIQFVTVEIRKHFGKNLQKCKLILGIHPKFFGLL